MPDAPFARTLYIDDEPWFGDISDNMSPIIVEPVPEGTVLAVPGYLLPIGSLELGQTEDWRASEAGENSRREQFLNTARQLGSWTLTLDRQGLLDTLQQPMAPEDYLTAFALYTSLIRIPGSRNLKAHTDTSTGTVVYSKVRADLKLLLAKGEAMLATMPEAEADRFAKAIAGNFSVKRDDGANSNPSIFMAKNALLDIVSNPDSVLAADTVMATRILRTIANDPKISINAVRSIYGSFIKDCRGLINNPELLFLLDDKLLGERKVSRRDVMNLSGGIVTALFHRVQATAPAESYQANLAAAYFKIADKAMEDSGQMSRLKPSEGNARFTPIPLVSLAKLVAKSNPKDSVTFSPAVDAREFSKAFDYLLPMLDLEQIWPELDSETVATVEKALSKVIHLTDSLFV